MSDADRERYINEVVAKAPPLHRFRLRGPEGLAGRQRPRATVLKVDQPSASSGSILETISAQDI